MQKYGYLLLLFISIVQFSTVSFAGDYESCQTEYYDNGQVKVVWDLKFGRKNAKFKEYYEDGTLLQVGRYKNGKLSGKLKEYYENGKLKMEQHFRYGKQHGPIIRYFEDGGIEIECVSINGKLQGLRKDYYRSGQLRFEFEYVDDEVNYPSLTHYDQNGELSNGYRRSVNRDGWLEWETSFVNGKIEGEAKGYHENGKLREIGVVAAGVLLSKKKYDENGILILDE